jgi:hypothetical protein
MEQELRVQQQWAYQQKQQGCLNTLSLLSEAESEKPHSQAQVELKWCIGRFHHRHI